MDSIHGSPLGLYSVVGGGWYYRYSTIDKDYVVPPIRFASQSTAGMASAAILPGSMCPAATIAARGISAGGLNAGVGFTVRLSDSGWKFYHRSPATTTRSPQESHRH